jgi:hypothetical protein
MQHVLYYHIVRWRVVVLLLLGINHIMLINYYCIKFEFYVPSCILLVFSGSYLHLASYTGAARALYSNLIAIF